MLVKETVQEMDGICSSRLLLRIIKHAACDGLSQVLRIKWNFSEKLINGSNRNLCRPTGQFQVNLYICRHAGNELDMSIFTCPVPFTSDLSLLNTVLCACRTHAPWMFFAFRTILCRGYAVCEYSRLSIRNKVCMCVWVCIKSVCLFIDLSVCLFLCSVSLFL